MVDKISKFLDSLQTKELISLRPTIKKIECGNLKGLDVKKLRGYRNVLRVRKGVFRILIQEGESKFEIISISRRSEKTYK